jgi:hypothetical protein
VAFAAVRRAGAFAVVFRAGALGRGSGRVDFRAAAVPAFRVPVARAAVLALAVARRVVFFPGAFMSFVGAFAAARWAPFLGAFATARRAPVVLRATARAVFFFFTTLGVVPARRDAAAAEVFSTGRAVDRLDGRAGLGRLAMDVPRGVDRQP